MERELRVKRKYSFWRHPIRWFKDRKTLALMDFLINRAWENGLKEKAWKAQMDMLLYGSAVFDKDGNLVPHAVKNIKEDGKAKKQFVSPF